MSEDERSAEFEAEARRAQERLRLHQARIPWRRSGDPERLRELERERARTAIRLRRARTVPENN